MNYRIRDMTCYHTGPHLIKIKSIDKLYNCWNFKNVLERRIKHASFFYSILPRRSHYFWQKSRTTIQFLLNWNYDKVCRGKMKKKPSHILQQSIEAPSTRMQLFLNRQLQFFPDSKISPSTRYRIRCWFIIFHSEEGIENIWIRWLRVDWSRIQKEKAADSKLCGYVWTGPESLLENLNAMIIKVRDSYPTISENCCREWST